MLTAGKKAPDFTLTDDKGTTASLSQFKGKKVVIYFYPKDNTPGCTKEACAFRDIYDVLLAKGAVVIGISADSENSHAKFKEKYDLPFFLLSDPEKKVIKEYGAWGEKKLYGNSFLGIIRSTFIIDEKGIISKVFPKVTPKDHADEVLAAL
ncbi:MAG: thioredoxin-dependent thiol peroxidase [Spirochaetales bacterium]|nr:thioredoxin-dependent thiol peroxidase [Spirochaetales bacterium]